MSSRLADALQLAHETRCLELGGGAVGRTPAVFRQFFGDARALVVADTTTFGVAGRNVHDALRRAGQPVAKPFVYTEPDLHAEHQHVVRLEQALKAQAGMIAVAVGSGTINDLAKLASHHAGRRYLVVGTAASMDGYTAYGASITYQGSKQTFACPAPLAVVADLDIICAAPPELNASGYADLLAKIPAGADWMLADAVGSEPINQRAWDIVQGGLREALADPAGVPRGDREAIRQLTEGLMLGGFAMQYAQSSRVASGAEHLFSHLWDMQHHTHQGRIPSHGFKVGIGTLAVAALYEYLLAQPIEALDLDRCCAQWPDDAARERRVRSLFADTEVAAVAFEESRAKAVDAAGLRRQLETVRRAWPDLRQRLARQLLPRSELKEMLRAAGAPVEPEQIAISRQRLRGSFYRASFLRRRFTALDLAARAGLMENALDQLFGPSGPWPV